MQLTTTTTLFVCSALALLSLANILVSSAPAAAAASGDLKVISDQDQQDMQQVKYHIANEYSEFKNIPEVLNFIEKVRLLLQKYPRNNFFAQGELKELLKFLSQESVHRVNRLDDGPFTMPISDDRIPLAQRAVEEDELTRKLFAGPLRSLIEARRQQNARAEDGNHKDGNFFANFWCKLSGNCPN